MADVSIPREAVDQGARELAELLNLDLDLIAVGSRQILREQAVAVLNVASRLVVAAELERIVKSIDTITDPASDAWMRAEKCGMRDVTRQLLQRAEQLRAQA